jgi:hypothetical protein
MEMLPEEFFLMELISRAVNICDDDLNYFYSRYSKENNNYEYERGKRKSLEAMEER